HPVPLAAPSYARDRASLRRRLRARGCSRAQRRRSERDAGRAPDRVIDAQPGRRQPAAHADRHQRHRVLLDCVRAWPWIARRRPRAREHTFDGLGATRVACLADVSATAPRSAGVRQSMTEPTGPDLIALPAPTVWPMVVALGVTLGFAGLVTHLVVS